ncbi:CAX-interacting protein 4 [Platanthera guangdongensis]|uniref:CAX-interacting protein 4 n=1 Tax=Platanthera guangdongensis TaxID=2320717 RepID=A0ABR2MIA2_9ASPA
MAEVLTTDDCGFVGHWPPWIRRPPATPQPSAAAPVKNLHAEFVLCSDAQEEEAKPSADRSSVGDGGLGENTYASFQGLLALARITGTNADDTRGSCKKCGRVGHLTFQCRNFLSLKAGREKEDSAADEAATLFHDLKRGIGNKEEESEEEEVEESSDSDLDPEMEKIIAARSGKQGKKESERRGRSKKRGGTRFRQDPDDDEDELEEEEGRKERRRKGKSRYSSSDDEDEGGGRRRKSRKESKKRKPQGEG